MATAIQMPKLGHTMSEGKVIHWHKQPGEPVREGEAILTIETDKTEVEVESPVAGVMGPHAAHEGDTVAVGGMLVILLAEGESPASTGDSARVSAPAPRRAAGAPVPAWRSGRTPHARVAPCPTVGRRARDRPRAHRRSRCRWRSD